MEADTQADTWADTQGPDATRQQALDAFVHERGDVLPLLAGAHEGHRRDGDTHAAAVDAGIALAIGLVDIGVMDRVDDWLARAADGVGNPAPLQASWPDAFWLDMGLLARVVHGALAPADGDATAAAVQGWLESTVASPPGPMPAAPSPDQRLIAAVMLVHVRFTQQRYEQFDYLASLVEHAPTFDRASPSMRARWHYILGFAHYQVSNAARAEAAWQRGLELAREHDLGASSLLLSLAMLRLLLDRGRLDDAERIEAQVQPQWGAGRIRQLIELQQMRARLHLLRDRPARALATVDEALALAGQSGLGLVEQASALTDRAQALVALGRDDEAAASLEQLARAHHGHGAEIFLTLHGLLQAWRLRSDDEPAARAHLRGALERAQQARYTMFLRLLPRLAGEVCALALRWRIEPVFVVEVIRARSLPAPQGAGADWPWAVWLRMLGGFDVETNGQRLQRPGKQQAKPLELLRALACETSLSLGHQQAGDALWPDADGAAARKSLDMTVQRLRRLLGDDSLVRVGDGRVSLDPARVSSDVLERRVLIERIDTLAMRPRGDAAEAARTRTELAALASAIVALSGGVLLPGAPEVEWLLAERARVGRELRRAVDAAAAVLVRDGADAATSAPLLAALRRLTNEGA